MFPALISLVIAMSDVVAIVLLVAIHVVVVENTGNASVLLNLFSADWHDGLMLDRSHNCKDVLEPVKSAMYVYSP